MFQTWNQPCGQPHGQAHPTRKPKYSDVKKPRCRGGCPLIPKVFEAPAQTVPLSASKNATALKYVYLADSQLMMI
jgi:hypothetical protein